MEKKRPQKIFLGSGELKYLEIICTLNGTSVSCFEIFWRSGSDWPLCIISFSTATVFMFFLPLNAIFLAYTWGNIFPWIFRQFFTYPKQIVKFSSKFSQILAFTFCNFCQSFMLCIVPLCSECQGWRMILAVSEKERRNERWRFGILSKLISKCFIQVNFSFFMGLLRSCFFLVMISYLYFFLKIFGK